MRLLILLTLLASPAFAQVYESSPAPIPIPNNAPGIRSDIVVSGGPASVQSLRVRLTIHHPQDNDIGIWLVPPGVSVSPPYTATSMGASSAVPLSYSNGGTGDDFLDSQFTGTDPCFIATYGAGSGSPPFDQLYNAGGLLTNFYNTNANGTWGLVVYDQAQGHVGELVTWSMEFAGAGLNCFQRPLLHGSWSLVPGRLSQIMRFDLAAPAAQTLQSLSLNRLGSGADQDIGAIELWHDVNHDGYLDTTVDHQLGVTQTFSSGVASFGGLGFNINQGWASVIVLAEGTASGAGNEIGVSLNAVSCLPGPVFTSLPVNGPVGHISAYISSFPADEAFDGRISATVSLPDIYGTPVPVAPDVDTAPSSSTFYTRGRVRTVASTIASYVPGTLPNHVALDRGLCAIDFRYDLSSYSPANHAFGFQFRWASTGAAPRNESGVFVSDDGGATWFSCLFHFPFVQGSSSPYQLQTIDLSAALIHAGKSTFTSKMIVRIQHRATTGTVHSSGMLLDSVSMRLATKSIRVSAGMSTTVVNGSDGIGELDFGSWDVNAGPSAPVTITVENIGSSPVALGTPGVGGSGFTVDTTGYFGTLAANASTSFKILFDPSYINSFEETVSFTHGAFDATNTPYLFGVRGSGIAAPPFEVRESTVLGQVVPYGSGGTGVRDFGSWAIGATSPVITLHIINTSAQTITFGLPTLIGSDTGHFVLDTTGFIAVLGPMATTSVALQFQPTSVRLKQVQLSFSHSASGIGTPPNPWKCGIQGTGALPPTVDVSAATQMLLNGAAASGVTNFGNQVIHAGATTPVVITISNTGTQSMSVGVPILSGADATEFQMNTNGMAATVGGGQTTTFELAFDPITSGAKNAAISFVHSATNTSSPFVINIAGSGVATAAIEVRQSSQTGSVVTSGAIASGPFAYGPRELSSGPSNDGTCHISNTGSANLVLGTPVVSGSGSAEFSLNLTGFLTTVPPGNSTSFSVNFDPSSNGAFGATISFTQNDPLLSNPSFSFDLSGSGFTGAWIAVREENAAGAAISDNGNASWSDFGPQDIGVGPTATKTVWIQNIGSSDLILGSPTLSEQPGPALTMNISGLLSTVTPGNGTSFSVSFDPTLVAVHSFTISLTHNSADGVPTPYRINFKGVGTTTQNHPIIEVRDSSLSGSTIANGSGASGSRYFGTYGVGATSPVITIYVLNSGSAALPLGTPSLGGVHPGDFSVDLTNFNATVGIGQATSFGVSFRATYPSDRQATVSFAHGALNESSSFSFSLAGKGVAIPVLEVRENSVAGPLIPDGASSASGGRDFGFVDVNSGPSTPLTVVLHNPGSVNVTLSVPVILTGGSEFSLNTNAFITSVPPNSSTSFEIYFDPTSVGGHNAHIRISHNATPPGSSGVVSHGFVVAGHGTNGPVPVLEIHENTVAGPAISHGSAPSAYREYGSFDINSGPTVFKTYTITNGGGATLNLGTLSLPYEFGYNRNSFVIDSVSMASSIQPAQSTTFRIAFNPDQVGVQTGLVRLTHGASATSPSPFEFEVSGTGTGTPNQSNIQVRENSSSGPLVQNGSAATGTGRDFGVLVAGNGPSAALTVFIRNWGSADLVMGTPSLTGLNTSDFKLDLTGYTNVVSPSGDTSFTLAFDPQSVGSKSVAISISHNAGVSTGSPFTFDSIGLAVAPGASLVVHESSVSGTIIPNSDPAAGTAREFGQQESGSGTGPSLLVYVHNGGSSAMNLGVPVLTGADANHFLIDTSSFTPTLAVGSSTYFSLSFSPVSAGPKQAHVEFLHDAVNTTTPFAFEIAGEGTSSGSGDDEEEASCAARNFTPNPALGLMVFILLAVLTTRKFFLNGKHSADRS
ncbi:choice-of-anchor D domain-containing protein [Planctomycetota bacterium]|nr:choice-of-anchor D domain-containing protein [Planctomycetota bacterium]